jgi:hypothetical protein
MNYINGCDQVRVDWMCEGVRCVAMRETGWGQKPVQTISVYAQPPAATVCSSTCNMADCLTEHAAATNTDLTQAVDELTLASEGPSETTNDTSLVLWEGTLYANPALLTTVNSGESTMLVG